MESKPGNESTSKTLATSKKTKKKGNVKKDKVVNNENDSIDNNDTNDSVSINPNEVKNSKKTRGGGTQTQKASIAMTTATIPDESLHMTKQSKRKLKKSNMLRLRDDGFSSSTTTHQQHEETQEEAHVIKNPGQGRRNARKQNDKLSLTAELSSSSMNSLNVVPQLMQQRWLEEYERDTAGGESKMSQASILSANAQVFVPNSVDSTTRSVKELQKSGRKKKKKHMTGSCTVQNYEAAIPEGVIKEEDSLDDEACLVCAKPIKYLAVGKCGHPICSLCAMRLRIKSKEKDW